MLLRVTSTVWLNQDTRRRRSSCLMAADGRRRQWTGRARTSERRKREGQTGNDRERRRIDMRSSHSPDIPSPELYLYVSFLHARPARLPRLPLSLFYSLFGIESTLINQPDVSKLLGTLSKSQWIRYLKRYCSSLIIAATYFFIYSRFSRDFLSQLSKLILFYLCQHRICSFLIWLV